MPPIRSGIITLKSKIESVTREAGILRYCEAEPGCTYSQESAKFQPRNFARHIAALHPRIYNLLDLGDPVPEEPTRRRTRPPVEPTDYALVRVNKQRVIGGVIKLMTKHSLPFNALNWEGMKDILGPQLDPFKVSLTNRNAPELVGQVRQSVDDIIRQEISGKFISLKFDIVSKHNRSMLGVNAQFYKNITLCKRTLGTYTIHIK